MQSTFVSDKNRRRHLAEARRSTSNVRVYKAYNENIHTYPIIVSIPHSGTYLPREVRRQLTRPLTLPNMDWHLDRLYDFLQETGVTVIVSNISRYVVDLNRDSTTGANDDYKNAVVYEKTTFGRPMYAAPLNETEVNARIEQYYNPYHEKLECLIEDKLTYFDKICLIDMHSFFKDFTPEATQDILLSDFDHKTAEKPIFDCLKANLEAQGYSVGDNPIKGKHILSRYKTLFGENINCIQLELRYTNYLYQRTFDEEEVHDWNPTLFNTAKKKLKTALSETFEIFKQDSLAK